MLHYGRRQRHRRTRHSRSDGDPSISQSFEVIWVPTCHATCDVASELFLMFRCVRYSRKSRKIITEVAQDHRRVSVRFRYFQVRRKWRSNSSVSAHFDSRASRKVSSISSWRLQRVIKWTELKGTTSSREGTEKTHWRTIAATKRLKSQRFSGK